MGRIEKYQPNILGVFVDFFQFVFSFKNKSLKGCAENLVGFIS
jgi:hypothetical protein